jgi:hypothetical protein
MIATFAALQDWDGVFLFAYSHNSEYDKDKISSFFDIEGNPAKMPLMPMGARLFAAIQPDEHAEIAAVSYKQLLQGVPHYSGNQADFLSHVVNFDPALYLNNPIAIRFDGTEQLYKFTKRAEWTANGPGSGRFTFADPNAAVFAGFARDRAIDLAGSDVRIESISTPFATVIVMPTIPGKKIADSDKLLITAIARTQNTNMGWTANRLSVGNQWGKPPVQIEVVQARISIPGKWKHAYSLDTDGKPTTEDLTEIQGNRTIIRLGSSPALAYEVTR